MDNNNFGQELAKQTLDQIPQANSNAKRIVGLVKEGGRITGYQLSDNSIVEKQQAVNMAKQGQIPGVGIAHRGDTEYLKSIPNGNENNNLGDYIVDLKIPMEQVIEEKNGKKKVVESKLLPCYVFIKMIYTNQIWYYVTSTRGVTGFCGPQGLSLIHI